jgi:glycylpeptide N-tetradecanoyltransferase
LAKFPLAPVYDEHDFAHWFLPRPDVISCYVVQDSATKEITEMISFYNLPSTVLQNPKHNHLKAAYSYYHVNTNATFQDLFNDALILASKEEFDVFNALDVMENTTIFKELKFGVGDGNLHYYLYNWKCPEMQAGDVGLVLL